LGWNKSCIDVQGRLCTVLFHGQIGAAAPIWPWNCTVRKLKYKKLLFKYFYFLLDFFLHLTSILSVKCGCLLLHLITPNDTHTHTHARQDSSWRVIGPSQRPLSHNTIFTREKQPYRRRDANPQSQQVSGRRPTPHTARVPGSAIIIPDKYNIYKNFKVRALLK